MIMISFIFYICQR